jgi:NADH-quinone oxidoreductase subunit L
MNNVKRLGRIFYKVGDQVLIDDFVVNGAGQTVSWLAFKTRVIQNGYLYHYVAMMLLGLFGFLFWFLEFN